MGRHWNTTIKRSKVVWRVKSRHPIATAWSNSPSKYWRGYPVQWHHRRVQEEEGRWWFAMVTWRMDINSGERRRSQGKVAILLESKLFQSIPVPSSTSNTGHSGNTAIDPTLQDNVLLPKRFTDYIFHVGNASEWNSIIRNGLIPGGKSLKKGRQVVFFTTVNLMEDGKRVGRGKLHATWRNQGSPHTRILGNVFIILYFDAIWSSLKRKACNSIKHGHMQSFSTTHNLRLVLRKRYVWKHRTSSTKRFAWLQECHELYPNRTRNTVNKIHKAKKQDHLGTHQAIRRVAGKPVAKSWITEFLEYLFLQSSSRIQHVKTRSRSWSRSSRTTSSRNPSFRTLARRRRSTSSAKNRRNLSPTWTTLNSSN